MRSSPYRLHAAILGSALAAVLVTAQPTHAEVSPKVEKQFRGQILVSNDALPEDAGSEAETLKAFKKLNLSAIKHRRGSDGVAAWSFHFMAFMNRKPGTSQIALDFYTADKARLFVASKRLAGIDPQLTLLRSRIDINEDEGLNKGGTYEVRLVAETKGKEVVLATTRLKVE
jgi:hypothetical protein